jgi:ABC-type amino acid transport substrate-binding protein
MTGPIVDTGPYGIDFPKGAKQFEHAAQAALNAIKKSGTYSTILNKWGEGAGAINSFTINAAAAYGQ